MVSQKKRVAEYILEHPTATNEEIANRLDIKEASVKSYISKLKTTGMIKIKKVGQNRTIETIEEYQEKSISAATAEKIELRRETYMKLLDRYMDDFDLTDDIDKHLKLGNSILRILDNL